MRYRHLGTAYLLHAMLGMATPAQAAPEPEAAVRAVQPDGQEQPLPRPAPCSERPWYCGVSEDQQRRALLLYEEGNQLFDDSLFAGAADKYRAALAQWDHPSIHYNLMLAQVALERPIEAYESSLAALRYGSGALRPEEHRRARDYQKLLRGRIAVLEVSCNEPGAVVSLDGAPLFHAPGSVRRFVLPGQHELVAKKPGYLTSHRSLMLVPDEPQRVEVAMLSRDQAMIATRRWQRWRPWAVVGAGVGAGLLGAALEWRANVNNRAFESRFDEECPAPDGCFEPSYGEGPSYGEEVARRQQRYTWYRRLGHGVSVAGAATALTGLVLVTLNRPRQVENPARRRLIRVSAAPDVRPESATLGVRVDF